MDLLNVLSKLTAIETGVVAEEGTKVSYEKATGSNSDIENVLRGLMSIQEESSAKLDEEQIEEGSFKNLGIEVQEALLDFAEEIQRGMHSYDDVVDELNDMFDKVKASQDPAAIEAFKILRTLKPEDFGPGEGGGPNRSAAMAQDAMDAINGEIEEGNEFSGALAKAKATGAKEFEVDGKKYQVKEAGAPIDFDKVLEAIAALYGDYFDDIWETDAMQDLANDLEQAGPTDQELDFIIAKGKLPKRLANIQFSAGDNVQFGEGKKYQVKEGSVKSSMMKDAETMSKADFIKKYGQENADTWETMNESVDLAECGEMEMPMEEDMPEAPMYTLNIRNGASNLSMTTSAPEEIIAIMKLAGLNGSTEVSQHAPVEEEFANTPAQTNERSPRLHGDIADWGRKGTANAKTHYTPASQGDNPLGEESMMEQYKKFKQSK
jgi:CRISPR/Cas system CSM-associated protein Csm2 small subunit